MKSVKKLVPHRVAKAASARTALPAAGEEHWEARRRRLRQELIDEGLRQFQARGFDAVTVTDIVENVDISRRSFFRYFDSKEDLAFSWMDDSGEIIRPMLRESLRKAGLMAALRDCFLEAAARHDSDPERITQLTRLAFETPSLRGRYQYEYVRWENEFAQIAQQVLKLSEARRYELHVQSALAITAWASALQEWARHDHRKPLRGYVITAFAILLKNSTR